MGSAEDGKRGWDAGKGGGETPNAKKILGYQSLRNMHQPNMLLSSDIKAFDFHKEHNAEMPAWRINCDSS